MLKREKQVRHCAHDAGVRRTCARRTPASCAQLGFFFSLFGAVNASFQISRFQRITEAPPEPSLCKNEVLLMLMIRSS